MPQKSEGLKIYYYTHPLKHSSACYLIRITLLYLGGCYVDQSDPFNEELVINDPTCWKCYQQTALSDASVGRATSPKGHSCFWGSPYPMTD